jgi:hypothetical protein
MKKKLNVDLIQSELRGGSAFFPNYKGGVSPTPQPVVDRQKQDEVSRPAIESNPQASERPNARTGQHPNGKRIITRNSFEIYEDQMDSLRKLSYQEKMDGKLGSMSGMVREAIDNYLLKRSLTE